MSYNVEFKHMLTIDLNIKKKFQHKFVYKFHQSLTRKEGYRVKFTSGGSEKRNIDLRFFFFFFFCSGSSL